MPRRDYRYDRSNRLAVIRNGTTCQDHKWLAKATSRRQISIVMYKIGNVIYIYKCNPEMYNITIEQNELKFWEELKRLKSKICQEIQSRVNMGIKDSS